MKLTLGFSPCPNDTFIFDALVNNKIDTRGLQFDVVLDDVQKLNEWAVTGQLDITKLSYGVLPLVLDKYILLNSGSALGRGVGPLLIQKPELRHKKIEDCSIALPGENTTAHLLFSLAYPNAKNKTFLRYNEVEDFVVAGKGLGVIIHENRFTYAAKGLEKITDLGEYWEKETGLPIPLGGIVAKRSVDRQVAVQVDELIKESIGYAYRHHHAVLASYVKTHAQEMSEDVMQQHIGLYVNDFSVALGKEGKQAVKKLLGVFKQANPGVRIAETIFIDEVSL